MSFILVMGQGPYVGASLLNHPDVASPHRHLVVFLCLLFSDPSLSTSPLFFSAFFKLLLLFNFIRRSSRRSAIWEALCLVSGASGLPVLSRSQLVPGVPAVI